MKNKGKGSSSNLRSSYGEDKNELVIEGQNLVKESMVSAEAAIDQICLNGAVMLYEEYLKEKVKPYELKMRSLSAKETCQFKFVPGQLIFQRD